MKTLCSVRSSYSFLQSLLNMGQITTLTQEAGYEAVLLSDVNVLYGANQFFQACQKAKLKPLFGLELSVLKERFVVVAKNNDGYKQLILLSLLSDKGELDFETFSINSSQCIVIYCTEGSLVEPLFLQDQLNESIEHILNFKKYFRDLAVGFSLMQAPLFQHKNKQLIKECQNNHLKTIALEIAYYAHESDEEYLKILQAIDKNVTLSDSSLISQPYHAILSSEERDQLYDAATIENTNRLALECNVDLNAFKTDLPTFKNDYGVESTVFLSELSKAGLKKRLNGEVNDFYSQRLDYELSVINEMGYVNYFLIVYDFILFAKKNGIFVGPGRGSGAASLVAYSLGIVDIDPLKYDLIFERFLNPERISMPDFDNDFEDTRRDEVIDYVREKYGDAHIAHIITFSTLSQRQVVRDVGKVLGANPKLIDQLSKAMVNRPNMTLSQSLSESKELREIINTRSDAKRIFEVSLKLEGLPRQRSLHAAGIVMSKDPLTEVIPIVELADQSYCTQFTMEQLERYGLVKMDFLGLKNLSILSEIVASIDHFDLKQIPLNDQKTYRLISSGYTLGIFQLESDGMKAMIKQMSPYTFMDIVDAIALYRPGPMQFRGQYIHNRQNPQDIEIIHPSVDSILASTHGILIYQEQVLQIAREFAGFSYGKADILRKAMSKKDSSEMSKLKDDFLKSEPQEVALKLWEIIERFASYGFNKAHSVSYALIAYQLAYLKANYPLIFYKALLNSVIGSSSKLKAYTNECKSRNIKLLQPSINFSYAQFTLQEGGIRFCLAMIKSIGIHSAQVIQQIRYDSGLFRDYIDCVARLNKAKINQTQIENLIHAGAFDEFNLSRMTMIHNLPEVLKYAEIIKIELDQQTILDFELMQEPRLTMIKENALTVSANEVEVLGFHFSTHPVQSIRSHIRPTSHFLSQAIQTEGQFEFIGLLIHYKEIMTKKNEAMALLEMEDEFDRLNCILFPRDYVRLKELLKVGQIYRISGQGQSKEESSFIIKRLERVN